MQIKEVFKSPFFLSVVGYLILTLIGFWFLTKSWLPPGFIVAGHDSGLAIDSKKFLESRLYAWDEHINFGQDNSFNFGSITLHLIDYLLAAIAGTDAAGNQVALFFWLAVIFLSALIFALSLKDYFGRIFVFIFPIFTTFNFYIFQSMFMLERAKYGLFAATLLFLAITLKVLEGKLNIIFAVFLSTMIFFIFNGGGLWGFPLYGGILVAVLVLSLHTFILSVFTKKRGEIKKLFAFLFLTSVGYILINSYAILPYFIRFVRGGASTLFSAEVIAPNKSWLDYISQASSFLNIFRLQGIPDWYDNKTQININHPFAQGYTKEPLLIIISFLFPILAFSSFLLARTAMQKRLVSLFALVILVSMVFVAGTHVPLGFIYDFLYDKIPGFAIFRTPFYKFGSVFFLGMAVLISFALSSMIDKLAGKVEDITKNEQFKNITIVFLTTAVVLVWFFYHRPLLSPQVLYWQKKSTTKIEIPNYVRDFKAWAETRDIKGRILLLPPLDEGWKVDSYKWGYWSLSSLPSMFFYKNTTVNDVTLTNNERNWLWELYFLLEEGKEKEALVLSQRLGINYFLVREDISVDNSLFNLKSPERFLEVLHSFKFVSQIASFGEWIIFKIDSQPQEKIYATSGLVEIPKEQLFLYRDFAKSKSIFLKEKKSHILEDSLFDAKFISYQCASCIIEQVETNTVLPTVTILPNSPFYILKRFRENTELLAADTNEAKIDAYLGFTLRRTGEVKQMLDFRAREKYLLDDLKVMSDYLAVVYQLLSPASSHGGDFEEADRIIRILHPIEANLRIEIDKAKSGTFSEGVIQGMTDILWQIYKIKSFYSEILSEPKRWAAEKIYNITLSQDTGDKIFIGMHFLPFDNQGNRVLPKEAILSISNEELPLKINPLAGDILELTIPKRTTGQGRLSIRFLDLPNKFNFKGYRVEETPRGPVGCYYGNVKRFDKTHNYKIEVMAANKDQILKLFVREEREEDAQLTYFLKGQREVSIFPILSYEPFTFIYNPSAYLDYLGIYICSENRELPQISEVIVKEIFSPFIVLSQTGKNNISSTELPLITFDKRSPIKYDVTIQNSAVPFILVFNERFDPLWQIRMVDGLVESGSLFRNIKRSLGLENASVHQIKHFTIDGYANAWNITDTGSGKFVIEYIPQKFFYLGVGISVITLIVSIAGILFFIKKNN